MVGMGLVVLYYLTPHSIIDKIIESFDTHNMIYSNMDKIMKLPFNEFKKIICEMECETWRYSNFQHLIVYGLSGCGKEYLVNKLLEKNSSDRITAQQALLHPWFKQTLG